MAEEQSGRRDEAGADAEAVDAALAAFEDACAQLIAAAREAADHRRGQAHLAAVRERLAADSVPVTASTADALLLSAADARAALQPLLEADADVDPAPDGAGGRPREDEDEDVVVESDPVLDLAPDPDPDDGPVEPPPAPNGYRASTSLPTRTLPHILVFDDGRWQRASIAFAPDDTLVVRTATARRGPGRRLSGYSPAQIALPQARG